MTVTPRGGRPGTHGALPEGRTSPPCRGEPGGTKGDLAALWVHKFKSQGQLYLLGYTLDEGVRLVYLEAIGSHENFYRDLNR